MKNRDRNLQRKRALAKERRRRQKKKPILTEEELTKRQISKLLREQEQFLKQQTRGLVLKQDPKAPGIENFQRRVSMAADDPLLRKPLSRSKGSKKKRRYRERNIGRPIMREVLCPFPQGRRLLLRMPTAKNPLTYKEYQHYLKSEHWQQFKAEYEESDRQQECYVCGDPRYELHHWTYARIGKEDLRDVIPLCRIHHETTHKMVKQGLPLAHAHTYARERFSKDQL